MGLSPKCKPRAGGGKSGGGSGAPGWGTQTSTVGEKKKKKKKKGKDGTKGRQGRLQGRKLESLFSVLLCLHRTRIPNPTGFFPSSKKAGPHFIGFEARRRHWRIGGGRRCAARRQPHAAEFSEKRVSSRYCYWSDCRRRRAATDARRWRLLLLSRVLSMNDGAAAAWRRRRRHCS